jgi:hypothetical protein
LFIIIVLSFLLALKWILLSRIFSFTYLPLESKVIPGYLGKLYFNRNLIWNFNVLKTWKFLPKEQSEIIKSILFQIALASTVSSVTENFSNLFSNIKNIGEQ